MANSKISDLNALTGANTASDDVFAIVDTSASETKKITRAELVNALELGVFDAVQITGGTINGAVIGGSTAAAITGTALVANTSINIAGDGATVTGIKDEDNMASNSAVKLATQQSIKAYVDTQVATIPTGDITAVTAGTGLSGGGTTGDVTVTIDGTVTTLTGSQTLTNKTMTSPVLDTAISGTAFLDEDNMSSNSATKVASQQSIKAYVDAQIGTADTLSEVLGLGNTTGGTNIVVSVDDVISLDDGTNALPSLAATGDLNTGLYFPAADEVGLTAGGTQRLKATSAGVTVTGTMAATAVTGDGSGLTNLPSSGVTAGFAIAMAVAL